MRSFIASRETGKEKTGVLTQDGHWCLTSSVAKVAVMKCKKGIDYTVTTNDIV